MNQMPDTLSHHALLEGLTSAQIDSLQECAEVINFAPGQRLMEQGRWADRFFLIQRGRVSIEVYSRERGPRPIQEVGAGDLLGSSSWMEPYKWQFDARATEPTQALVFNARMVQRKCDADPELSAALLKRFFIALAQRLDAAQKQLLALYAGRA
jgi:CRP/FNR family transcriptional regulator, cyclic AMP receptor protein